MCYGSGLLLLYFFLILIFKKSNKSYQFSSRDIKYPDIKGGDAGKFKVEVLLIIFKNKFFKEVYV